MKTPLLLVVPILIAAGCCGPGGKRSHRTITTPLEVSGPVTVSGPVMVTGPVTGPSVQPSAAVRSSPPAASAMAATTAPDGETRLELKTEDLSVQKNTVSNGAARIRKYVVSEERSIPVSLRREEFTVERIPASGPITTPFGEGESVIDLPLTMETVAPVITPRVYEVIRVRKTVETDTHNVTGTIRTEKFDVQRTQ